MARKYTGIKIFRDNVEVLDLLAKENPTACRIFLFIANNMDNKNSLIGSYKTFVDKLEISTSTVFRGLRELQKRKILTIEKYGNNNIYVLNNQLVATSTHQKQTKKC